MTPLLARIKAKGHWRVSIRPTEYVERRVSNLGDLFSLARASAVDVRGWDFPHIDEHRGPTLGDGFVEYATDWEHFKEQWRIYQNGNFVFFGGIWTDWLVESSLVQTGPLFPRSAVLPVGDAVTTCIEVFEFAARLATSPAGADYMFIEVRLAGLEGRTLWFDVRGRHFLRRAHTASGPTWGQEQEVVTTELLGNAEDLALRFAQQLFGHFGWNPEIELLRDIANQTRLYPAR